MSPDAYQTIIYEIGGRADAVCTITLNRPDKFNAINRRMAEELVDAFRRVREVPTVGVVVLFLFKRKRQHSPWGALLEQNGNRTLRVGSIFDQRSAQYPGNPRTDFRTWSHGRDQLDQQRASRRTLGW